ncbi:hypothetical protein IJG66_02190 [Candidatus Saccharibacteria bacterium]|nr:hypothetical protein [Candidatus Saccharibacteria bacterium]
MCKIIATEYGKLDDKLNGIMRNSSPSLVGTVIRNIQRLYDAIGSGRELEVIVTKDHQTYIQLHDKDGTIMMTDHFSNVFSFGDKTPGQIALLDMVDALVGSTNEEEHRLFDEAKDKVKHSQAFCLSLRFKKS